MNARFSSATDIRQHEIWFSCYAADMIRNFAGDPLPLTLKQEHSRQVLRHARHMVRQERPRALVARACLLAALYHDIARFAQYCRYGTFRDRDSCNHGTLGVRLLKRLDCLDGENPALRPLVLAGVGLHNRFALPPHLPASMALVACMVRDADKLDILRVMDEHLAGPRPYSPTVVLNLPDDPRRVSQTVLDAARHGRVAAYADLQSVNDFRVLLGTWLDDMHFASSRECFRRSPHVHRLLAGLPDHGPYAPVRALLLQRLERP